ncbi:hypothetical protein V2G26_020569 [Clonostachys chloroleuca]
MAFAGFKSPGSPFQELLVGCSPNPIFIEEEAPVVPARLNPQPKRPAIWAAPCTEQGKQYSSAAQVETSRESTTGSPRFTHVHPANRHRRLSPCSDLWTCCTVIESNQTVKSDPLVPRNPGPCGP